MLQTKLETESQGRLRRCVSGVKLPTKEQPVAAAARVGVGQMTTEMNRFALIANLKLDLFELSVRLGDPTSNPNLGLQLQRLLELKYKLVQAWHGTFDVSYIVNYCKVDF